VRNAMILENEDYDFSYDSMGRFEKILVRGSNTPSFQYYYDAASNERKRHNSADNVDQIYTPDALNRRGKWGQVLKRPDPIPSRFSWHFNNDRSGRVASSILKRDVQIAVRLDFRARR
jgi:hypothetical protein